MNLPSPRITPLCRITVDTSGLHCFPYFGDVGPGVMLWRDSTDVRIVPLPGAGYVKSGVTVGGYTYVVSGRDHPAQGPWRITRWTNDGAWMSEFVFGSSVNLQPQLLALKSGRVVCITYARDGSVNSQIAIRGLSGMWFTAPFVYAPNENRPPPLNLSPVQGPDGFVYILITQDSNALACLARHNDDDSFSVKDVNPSFLNRNTHNGHIIDGDMAHQYEMAWPTGVSDLSSVLFSYQKVWFEMVAGPYYLAGVSITRANPDGTKSLFATWPNASSPDRVERVFPGIPIFPRNDAVVSMQFAFDANLKRRWLVFETRRSDGASKIIRVIPQEEGDMMTSSSDGWLFYRPAPGWPFVLEKLFTDATPTPVPVPVPVPIPVPVPTPVPVPVPPTGLLTITTDMPEYQARQTIVIKFKSLPETIINGLVEPSNSKQSNVERRNTSIAAETDETGLLVARVVIKPSWKGPLKIEGEATKDAYSIGNATIYVPLV